MKQIIPDFDGYINESIEFAAFSEILGLIWTFIGVPLSIKEVFGIIKSRREDKELMKIIKRLKDDPEIVRLANIPVMKRKQNWKAILADKLSDEEIEYINDIHSDYFKEEN